MAIISQVFSYVIGVDTHAKEHVFAIVKASGELVATKAFRTNSLVAALAWVGRITGGDLDVLWAIEGTGTYGAILAQKAAGAGYQVVEAARMDRKSRRGVGKSDALDARRIANAVLALDESQMRIPRAHAGIRAALQILVTARDQMRTERTAAINALTALLRAWGLGIDARRPVTAAQITEIAGWRGRSREELGLRIARREAIRLARQIRDLGSELQENASEVEELVKQSPARALLEMKGVGPINAAVMFCAWSHPGRFRTVEQFKSLAGVNPIPASSGNTIRHRLNRGGDRRVNSALHMTAIVLETHDAETKAYVARRLAEGKTRKEIRRCLKTYLARRAFRALNAEAKRIEALPDPLEIAAAA